MNKEIETMLEDIGSVLKAAQTNVESMAVGERMQMKDLATAVGLAVAKEPKDIIEFVNYYVHNTTLAYVSRGKNGGVIRGTKSAKVVKPGKNTDTASSI